MTAKSFVNLTAVFLTLFCIMSLTGCAPSFRLAADYQAKKPRTIVLLPPENTTSNNDVEYKVYPPLFQYLARQGYYVISPEMVKTVFLANKLEDAGRINTIPVQKIGDVFGADAVMRCKVVEWSKKYIVISSSVNVGFNLELFDAKSGESLWQWQRILSKSPNNGGGNIIAALIVNAISAAFDQYEPVAEENAKTMLKTVPQGEYYDKW